MATARVFVPRKGDLVEVEGRLLPFKDGVQLFNRNRKWWLHYSHSDNTGPFPSKTKAVEWYDKGGR